MAMIVVVGVIVVRVRAFHALMMPEAQLPVAIAC
jgi:hypothetical protein